MYSFVLLVLVLVLIRPLESLVVGRLSRRDFALVSAAAAFVPLQPAFAASPISATDAAETLIASRAALAALLANWEKATIDCSVADVSRELLEQKNKEELLEKAKTFALFDKVRKERRTKHE